MFRLFDKTDPTDRIKLTESVRATTGPDKTKLLELLELNRQRLERKITTAEVDWHEEEFKHALDEGKVILFGKEVNHRLKAVGSTRYYNPQLEWTNKAIRTLEEKGYLNKTFRNEWRKALISFENIDLGIHHSRYKSELTVMLINKAMKLPKAKATHSRRRPAKHRRTNEQAHTFIAASAPASGRNTARQGFNVVADADDGRALTTASRVDEPIEMISTTPRPS